MEHKEHKFTPHQFSLQSWSNFKSFPFIVARLNFHLLLPLHVQALWHFDFARNLDNVIQSFKQIECQVFSDQLTQMFNLSEFHTASLSSHLLNHHCIIALDVPLKDWALMCFYILLVFLKVFLWFLLLLCDFIDAAILVVDPSVLMLISCATHRWNQFFLLETNANSLMNLNES